MYAKLEQNILNRLIITYASKYDVKYTVVLPPLDKDSYKI